MNKQSTQYSPSQIFTIPNMLFSSRILIYLVFAYCLTSVPLYAQEALLSSSSIWSNEMDGYINSLDWGDMNGDGMLDLAIGTNMANAVYLNDINGLQTNPSWVSEEVKHTSNVAWGDVDGDGDLDLAVGNINEPNQVYLNESGVLTEVIWTSDERNGTMSVAWGDVDGDGDLDLAVGNYGQKNYIYFNVENNLQTTPGWSSAEIDRTLHVTWGDVDGDGDLDLGFGNGGHSEPEGGQPNRVYLNEGGSLLDEPTWSSNEQERTHQIAWADINQDGNLDLAVADFSGCRLYLNDGAEKLQFSVTLLHSNVCYSATWGDINNDGDLDLSVGGYGIGLYINKLGSLTHDTSFSIRGTRITPSLAWGDIDGDGDIDLAAADNDKILRIYPNEGTVLSNTATDPFSSDLPRERWDSMAWGDIDSDGDLDLAVIKNVTEVADDKRTYNLIFLNHDGQLDDGMSWQPNINNTVPTNDLAWGDVDGDGDLDLAIASSRGPNYLYINQDGLLQSDYSWSSNDDSNTHDLAWGDVDGDGDLDLAVINDINGQRQSQLYVNNGETLQRNISWSSTGQNDFRTIAWGDVDNDGDLDLAALSGGGWSHKLYLNGGGRLQDTESWSSIERGSGDPRGLAWGDVDSDGDLDLAVDRLGIYFNNSGTLSERIGWPSQASGAFPPIGKLAWGDVDSDGDLDLAVAGLSNDGNRLYLNKNRILDEFPVWKSGGDTSWEPAWGDIDNNGTLDVIFNNAALHLSHHQNKSHGLAVGPIRPYEGMADFYAQSKILINSTIPLTYTLYGSDKRPVGAIRAEYSLNGGGQWFSAVPTDDTAISHLDATPLGVTHVYTWDTFASGFFGLSDNVVVRMVAHAQPVSNTVAISGTYRYPNTIPGPFQQAYASSTSYPFRVQGTRVQVYDETIAPSKGISNVIVYRMPSHQQVGEIMTDLQEKPWTTANNGYLQGRGQLEVGDRLVALYPIASTDQYTIYKTSAMPNLTGLDMFEMMNPGIQELIVSLDHALTIFDLSISLEWDARKDATYLQQLEADLQRTSELLYDVTNGQAALGQITIYHNREQWNEADIRIYATNRLRPHATIGGLNDQLRSVVLEPSLHTTEVITKVYLPGQVHMPATWNRTGENIGNLGEDWPRTLVHELGHYFFYLLENYMGLDEHHLPQSVTTCPGIMGNVYLTANSEMHPDDGWQNNCIETLQHQTMGRSDWETIQAFYPWFNAPVTGFTGIEDGPTTLPLAITSINYVEPEQTANTLDVATYYLIDGERSRYHASSDARAYLFKDDRVIDLGQPRQDRLQVWGAEFSDGARICVYDLGLSPPISGCKGTDDQIEQLTMQELSDWQPDIAVTAISSRTLTIETTNVSPTLILNAQIYPSGMDARPATTPITLDYERDEKIYRGTFSFINPPHEGRIHIWVDEDPKSRREAMLDYKLNGAPILRLGMLVGLKNGGTLMLSDDNVVELQGDTIIWGSGNTVILSDGSTLTLSDGTTLILSDGRTLVLDDGGTLTLSDGRTLVLDDGGTLTLSDGRTLVLDDGGTLTLSDGRTLVLDDGGTLTLSDGRTLVLDDGGTLQLSEGSTYMLSDGNGPILSSDGQVQIFGEALDFPAYEFYAFQSIVTLPNAPLWTTVVGQGYRLTRSDNAPDLAENSISFRYLGRDVPAGEESFLNIYHYDDNNWSRLETTIDLEHNLAVAPIGDAGEGIYVLMSTIDVALSGPGWELFGYPIQTSRPVTEALLSIDGNYRMIYTYDSQKEYPWKVYDINAPDYVNTLTELEFAKGYWIYLSESVMLYLKGNEDTSRPSSRSLRSTSQAPPTTFYGQLTGNADFSPTVDMVITAWIDGVACGQGPIQDVEGQLVYSISVHGKDSLHPECGEFSDRVTFQIDTQVLEPAGIWNNNQLWELDLYVPEDVTATPTPTSITPSPTPTATPDDSELGGTSSLTPPTTFYGQVMGSNDFQPEVGMVLTAWIDGLRCGQGPIQQEEDLLVYSISVEADSVGHVGCGRPDAEVIFQIDSQGLVPAGRWGNTQLLELDLQVPDISTSTPTWIPTPTFTPTATSTERPTPTFTPTSTPTPTFTISPTSTFTPTGTPTPTFTPTITPTPTSSSDHNLYLPVINQ